MGDSDVHKNEVIEDLPNEHVSIFDSSVKDSLKSAIKLGFVGEIFTIILVIISVNVLMGFAWNPIPETRMNTKIAYVNADNGLTGKSSETSAERAHSIGLNYKFLKFDESI